MGMLTDGFHVCLRHLQEHLRMKGEENSTTLETTMPLTVGED